MSTTTRPDPKADGSAARRPRANHARSPGGAVHPLDQRGGPFRLPQWRAGGAIDMISTIHLFLLLLLQLAGIPGQVRKQAPPDFIVYNVSPGSRLVVRTGKSGILGFAGHTHVIRARALSGQLVYRPGTAASSLKVSVPTDSLEVLTPPDTAEIRKVTEAMRAEVLHVDKYPTMSLQPTRSAQKAERWISGWRLRWRVSLVRYQCLRMSPSALIRFERREPLLPSRPISG